MTDSPSVLQLSETMRDPQNGQQLSGVLSEHSNVEIPLFAQGICRASKMFSVPPPATHQETLAKENHDAASFGRIFAQLPTRAEHPIIRGS